MNIVERLKLGDIPGWMDVDELIWLHDMAKGCRKGIEIGSFMGRSTCALAAAMDQNHGQLHCIDTFDARGTVRHAEFREDPPALLEKFKEHLGARKLSHLVVIHRGNSADRAVSSMFSDGDFDFVFIDGSHDGPSLSKDIQLYMPKVRKGGIICGHDYHPTWPQVVEVVDWIFGKELVRQHAQGIWSVQL